MLSVQPTRTPRSRDGTRAQAIARAAAARLTAVGNDPRLEAEVSRQIDHPDGTAPQDYEPVSLAVASVVISAATLAWTVYSDLRNDRKTANPDAIARRVRVRITDQHPDTHTGIATASSTSWSSRQSSTNPE